MGKVIKAPKELSKKILEFIENDIVDHLKTPKEELEVKLALKNLKKKPSLSGLKSANGVTLQGKSDKYNIQTDISYDEKGNPRIEKYSLVLPKKEKPIGVRIEYNDKGEMSSKKISYDE